MFLLETTGFTDPVFTTLAYVNLIKIGLRYASEGYNDIKVIWEDCSEEDDIEEFVEEYIKKWKEAHT